MPPDQGSIHVYAGFARPTEDTGLDCIRRFLIADVYARFRRLQGDTVIFSLGVEAFAGNTKREAERQGICPADLVARAGNELRGCFKRLRISCEPGETISSADPRCAKELQRRFLRLVERDLVYRTESTADGVAPSWLLRTQVYAEGCAVALGMLKWPDDALESQRLALGRTDGVETEAALLGYGDLTVFTPYPESIGQAAFVGVPKGHPVLKGLDLETHDAVAPTGVQAIVSEVDSSLPLIVVDRGDAPWGNSAWLGIPGEDEGDRTIAASLPEMNGLPFKSGRSGASLRPAHRYLLGDLTISQQGSWGVPIPVALCPTCFLAPLPADDLPWPTGERVTGTGRKDLPCPSCGAPSKLEGQTFHSDFVSMWMWAPTGQAEGVAARQLVWGAADRSGLLRQRIAGQLASALGETSPAKGEPFAAAKLVGSLRGNGGRAADDLEDLDELVSRAGADVARFALLSAAAPATCTRLTNHSIRHAERFLDDLLEFSQQRIRDPEAAAAREIDPSRRRRRRLAAWCAIAEEKIDASLDRLEMHRVIFEITLLFRAIQEFERRASSDGGLEIEDRDAIETALVRLAERIAPCLPETATKLSSERH